MKRLEWFVPVGRELKADIRSYLIGLFMAVMCSFTFFVNLWMAYADIIHHEVLVMQPFVYVLSVSLCLFPLLSLCCLSFIVFYYQMHFGSAKTMYLMRRLPDRWSLHRRCLTLPITMAVVTMVVALLLFVLYYAIYCAVTPEGFMLEGQMDYLVGNWFYGQEEWKYDAMNQTKYITMNGVRSTI